MDELLSTSALVRREGRRTRLHMMIIGLILAVVIIIAFPVMFYHALYGY